MTMRATLPLVLVLVCAALAAAGCGGSSSAGSSKAGATGSVAGTVAELPSGTSSFDIRFARLRQQLRKGLRQVQGGKARAAFAGADTVLSSCSDTVTSQLGAQARTPKQQQSVSQLRTACADAAQAVAKLKDGQTAAATQLARTALREVEQAGGSTR